MSFSDRSRVLVAGAALLVVAGVLATATSSPAQADGPSGGTSSWVDREDATASAPAQTFSSSQVGSALPMTGWPDEIDFQTDPSSGPVLHAMFRPPAGQTLTAGATYQVAGYPIEPTPGVGWAVVERDGRMCGRTEAQLFEPSRPGSAATGWLHVSELTHDTSGDLTGFAATYQLNCQVVGQSGMEGSIAMSSSQAAPAVPDAPATPGPLTGLTASNLGPDGGGTNATTLSWHNPTTAWGDTEIDMVQLAAGDTLPDVLGANDTRQYAGRSSTYTDGHVEFMDSRTYRVVPRGPSGRLGTPSYLTVMGTRMSVADHAPTITIGQNAQFTGRISESTPYTDPATVMDGPGLVGHALVLCGQSATQYVDAACDPVARTITGADGRYTVNLTPTENSIYTLRVVASPGVLGNTTWLLRALVAPVADLAAPEASAAARTLVRRGGTIHFSTSTARRGARGVVWLQRYDGHAWRTVATRRLPASSRVHRVRIPYRDRAVGMHAYRLVKPGDAHHVNGISRTVHVRVG